MIPPDSFAIIIGAMKSGTTTLYAHLARHPRICPCAVKEPDFFSRHQEHAAEGVERYEDLWDFDPSRHRWALEASTGYTKYPLEPGVPERMDAYGIRPRLIYIMRDPFERIESHHHSMRHSPRLRRRMLDDHHIAVSDYWMQLDRYRRVWPDAEMLLLDFARLREDPAAVVRRALAFLDLTPEGIPIEDLHENPTRARPFLLRWYARLMSGSRMRNPFPAAVKARVRKLVGNLCPGGRRSLSRRQRKVVHRRLAPGMRKLRDEFGFDVSGWGF
ncbi:MAG: sulfotransferase domain-containing protein [Candidatus Fermentibacteraceae bacterium]